MRAPPYIWRRLSHEQCVAIRSAFHAGVSARSLAAEYGVGVHTVYRAIRRAERRPVVVVVGSYVAPFHIGDEGPIQMGPWVPA